MNLIAALIAGLVPGVVAVVILRRFPRHRIGWLLLAHGVSVVMLLGAPALFSTTKPGMTLDQLSQGWWTFLFLWLVLIAYLLPDGRAASSHWRRWVRFGLAGELLFLLAAPGDVSGFRAAHHGASPPLSWIPEAPAGMMGVAGLVILVLFFFGAAPAVAVRLKRSSGDERTALLWFVWGALSVPLILCLNWGAYFLYGHGGVVATLGEAILGSVLPVTIGIAILRWRLFDIQVVLSRTLIYGLLLVLVTGAYAGILWVAGHAGGDRTAGGLVAVVVVAVAITPTHAWLQRRISRWVYGYRREPHEALRLLSERADSADPLLLVDEIATTIAHALHAERAWVEESGSRSDEHVHRVELRHRDVALGMLAVELPPGRPFSTADAALLDDLARQAAVLVRAGQLARDLQQSRSALVGAREEERRRLRRDLHDGVGPSLAAIVLKLNAAQSRAEAVERNALLTETREEARAAITEVRRLVDDLRPPAIDEVGLLGAIRQRAAAVSGDRLSVDVQGPESLPPLPAAVEVAAFRIASEAVTNVARHSGASRCLVEVSVADTFELCVSDNGTGSATSTGSGVGWTSMRERAAELGGSCTITSRAEGGLLVRAALPLDELHDPTEVNA